MEQPLIIVCYINVGNMPSYDVKYYLEKFAKNFESKPGEYIKHYFVPVREESRVECINPIRISDDDYKKVVEKLEETTKKMDELLKQIEDEKGK